MMCCPTATVRAPIESTAVHEPLSECFTYTFCTAPIVCVIAALSCDNRPPRDLVLAHLADGFPRLAKIRRLSSSTPAWFRVAPPSDAIDGGRVPARAYEGWAATLARKGGSGGAPAKRCAAAEAPKLPVSEKPS